MDYSVLATDLVINSRLIRECWHDPVDRYEETEMDLRGLKAEVS